MQQTYELNSLVFVMLCKKQQQVQKIKQKQYQGHQHTTHQLMKQKHQERQRSSCNDKQTKATVGRQK
jgi:hypothetical protein